MLFFFWRALQPSMREAWAVCAKHNVITRAPAVLLPGPHNVIDNPGDYRPNRNHHQRCDCVWGVRHLVWSSRCAGVLTCRDRLFVWQCPHSALTPSSSSMIASYLSVFFFLLHHCKARIYLSSSFYYRTVSAPVSIRKLGTREISLTSFDNRAVQT